MKNGRVDELFFFSFARKESQKKRKTKKDTEKIMMASRQCPSVRAAYLFIQIFWGKEKQNTRENKRDNLSITNSRQQSTASGMFSFDDDGSCILNDLAGTIVSFEN